MITEGDWLLGTAGAEIAESAPLGSRGRVIVGCAHIYQFGMP